MHGPLFRLARPLVREKLTMTEIIDEYMSLAADDKLVATARFSRDAAGDHRP